MGLWTIFHRDVVDVFVWAKLTVVTASAARLIAASVLNLETYAIWVLRHMLEGEVRDKGVANTLPGAARW